MPIIFWRKNGKPRLRKINFVFFMILLFLELTNQNRQNPQQQNVAMRSHNLAHDYNIMNVTPNIIKNLLVDIRDVL